MIHDLRPYPAMKDSGVPWLGQVPEHWEIRKVKWLFDTRKEMNRSGIETNILSLTMSGVIRNDPDRPIGLSPKDYGTYQIFKKGELVFKLIDLENFSTSRVGLVREDGAMSSAYLRLIPKEGTDQNYFFYQFYDLYLRRIFNQLGAGVRSTLGIKDLIELSIVLPSASEQDGITRFLDDSDRRIRKTIIAKTRLIKLLQEQKQVIIHRAVTRGVNPSVNLRPSGIEWLGDLPEGWEVKRAKYYFKEIDNRSLTGDEEMLSVSHITGVTPRSEKNVTMFLSETNVGQKICQRGDIAINILWAWMGALGVSKHNGIVSPAYGIYRQRGNDFLSDYLDYLLRDPSYVAEYVNRSKGVTSSRARMYTDDFFDIHFVRPPIAEQQEIVTHIESETQHISAAIGRAQQEITLLREYRTRLIADVVTGKLDVRDTAAQLPKLVGDASDADLSSDIEGQETDIDDSELDGVVA